ncbi:MAG: hypothetical protein ACRDPT_14395 [Streptomycetales bacterium]
MLIRTAPLAHHRELARRTGLPWRRVADDIENAGIVTAFERGQLTDVGFADAIRRLLSRPRLRTEEVEEAWNAVVAEPDPILAPVAAHLAAAGRLLLASNTNPFHWRLVRSRLAAVGINAPAWLSFEIGYAKPDQRFFAAVNAGEPQADARTAFVDDRSENVEAASQHGFIGWLHRHPASTARYLSDLLN